MKLACSVCGESSVAIVEREDGERSPVFTEDDVLDAHEFLRTWHGPVAELIKTA